MKSEQELMKSEQEPQCRPHERPSLFNVKFKELQGFEFWITAFNRIFLVHTASGRLGYPVIRATGEMIFEPSLHPVPSAVVEALDALLYRQRNLRNRLIEEGVYEDDEAWDWS